MNTFYSNNVVKLNQQSTKAPTHSEPDQLPLDFSETVAKLCIEHKSDKKWILLINGEEQTINSLSNQQQIDKSKILHINSRKVKVNADNIKTALTKGNCSAVVLAENNFESEQIAQLSDYAEQSNTRFMVFDKVSNLH